MLPQPLLSADCQRQKEPRDTGDYTTLFQHTMLLQNAKQLHPDPTPSAVRIVLTPYNEDMSKQQLPLASAAHQILSLEITGRTYIELCSETLRDDLSHQCQAKLELILCVNHRDRGHVHKQAVPALLPILASQRHAVVIDEIAHKEACRTWHKWYPDQSGTAFQISPPQQKTSLKKRHK